MIEKKIIYAEKPFMSAKALLEKLCVPEDDDFCERFYGMLSEAEALAAPCAVYAAYENFKRGAAVRFGNETIDEPFVGKMLGGSKYAVLYVATCGVELDAWAHGFTDFFEQYAAETIKYSYLAAAREALLDAVRRKYFDASKNMSSINPGSLQEWPITGQRALFSAIGDVYGDIGVSLTESMLMLPNKSVSGILFQSEEAFENCQLCPRVNCPGRRAKYVGD